jgi:hypothetical protein
MSLLEVVMALTLLVALAPIFFGIFSSHATVANNLSTAARMREAAQDMKSFVRLTNYGRINDLASGGGLLVVRDIDDRDFPMRDFVSSDGSSGGDCEFAVKLEFVDTDNRIGDGDPCAIPLRCRIFHLKSRRQSPTVAKLREISDMEYSTFVVKNR